MAFIAYYQDKEQSFTVCFWIKSNLKINYNTIHLTQHFKIKVLLIYTMRHYFTINTHLVTI